jgi:hypothetical protein
VSSSPPAARNPRDGGVILAVGNDKGAIETLVTTDPFSIAGICEYRITHFLATTVTPALDQYRDNSV